MIFAVTASRTWDSVGQEWAKDPYNKPQTTHASTLNFIKLPPQRKNANAMPLKRGEQEGILVLKPQIVTSVRIITGESHY
jgi:hypothetical protein